MQTKVEMIKMKNKKENS